MRFLQIEWHNHERARNSWDIERAEMKAKIAKQEGDCRSARKLNDLLEKQVKMLERALKNERAKNKAAAAAESPPEEEEVTKEWKGRIGVKPSGTIALPLLDVSRVCRGMKTVEKRANAEADSFPGIDVDEQATKSLEAEREAQRDKSKIFLQKCVEELTYLLTPPAHPIPPQTRPESLQNGLDYSDVHEMDPSMQEAYLQQQQQQQQPQPQAPPRRRNPQLSHLPSLPNHQPAPQRPPSEYQIPSQQPQDQTGTSNPLLPTPHEPLNQRAVQPDPVQQPPIRVGNAGQDVERVTHTFDAYGQPIPLSQEANAAQVSIADDDSGWNFDDSNTLFEPLPEAPPAQRTESDQFPDPSQLPAKTPPRTGHGSHRRKSSGANSMSRKRSSDGKHEIRDLSAHDTSSELGNFKVKFALRGHLDVIRAVVFTGGGSPSEPEICTTGDDGMIKRWILPASFGSGSTQPNSPDQQQPQQSNLLNDSDIQSYFTHRGHEGIVTSLAACPASSSFSTGGRALGDGWIFSGGQDATVRVWERGRVDCKATLDGHTDAVWAVCVLPSASGATLFNHTADRPPGNPSLTTTSSSSSSAFNRNEDRAILASGSADNSIKVWAVSAPPHVTSPSTNPSGNRRGVGGSRRHSVTSGSGFPSSPQPSTASGTPFHYQLLHNIDGFAASPTCISPLGAGGESFVVGFADSAIVIFDARTGEQVIGMASAETYDGTPATGVNSVVVAGSGVGGFEKQSGAGFAGGADGGDGDEVHGATGSREGGGVEGVVISGHEDRFVRFFDANSGMSLFPFSLSSPTSPL